MIRPFRPALRDELADLSAYAPSEGVFEVRLDANEAPPLLSPDAVAALGRAMLPASFSRYPDPRATELRAAVADYAGARPEEILLGCGSDEVIALLLTAFEKPREAASGRSDRRLVGPSIVVPSPTFAMYRISARARGYQVVEVPLDARWDLDVPAMLRAIEFARSNLVFLATPNNPTAASFSLDRLTAFLESAPEPLVVIDEAYVAYAEQKQAALRERFPNVALLGTVSKIGLAALRVGWLVADSELVAAIDKVRQPYNLPVPSQQGATFALRELRAELDRGVKTVLAERERLSSELRARGLGVDRSDANFLWVETPLPADAFVAALAARGVLVKSFGSRGGRLARRARITVGLRAENDRLVAEIDACAARR